MASGPTTSWHIDEGNMETVADFICKCKGPGVEQDWCVEDVEWTRQLDLGKG